MRRDEDNHKISDASQDLEAADLSSFSKSKTGGFVQRAPQLGNQFIEDNVLRGYLKRTLPEEVCESISRIYYFMKLADPTNHNPVFPIIMFFIQVLVLDILSSFSLFC